MSIKSEIKKLPKSQIEINISVPWEEWKKHIDQAASDYSKEIKIEGFRAGKAPRNMVEQKVGKQALLEAAAQKAIQETYPKIIMENKIDAIGGPKAEITKLAEGNEFEYKVLTAVVPEAKLGSWRKRVEKINKEHSKKKIEVGEEEIDKELENIAKGRVQHLKVDRKPEKETM